MKLAIPILLLAVLHPVEAFGQADSKPDTSKVRIRVSLEDPVRGITFDVYPDGRVELNVRDGESGEASRTYSADSLEEFREKHSDLMDRYGLDRYVGKLSPAPTYPGDMAQQFEQWKKKFQDKWFWDEGWKAERWFQDWPEPFASDELEEWFNDQRRHFEKFRRLRPKGGEGVAPAERGPSLGIWIGPVDESLAAHAGLEDGGILILRVRPGSLADKTGLRRHDILVTLNGKYIKEPRRFGQEVRKLLGEGKTFTLEVIRAGKRLTLDVRAEAS